MNPERSHVSGPVLTGLLIVGVGVILLLSQMDVLPEGFVRHFWPVILIALGLLKIPTGGCGGDRLVGLLLLAGGVIFQLNALGVTHVRVWDLWPLVIIIVGLSLVWQAVQGKFGGPALVMSAQSQLNSVYVFGGGERQVNTKDFRGGRLVAIFGGYKVDLTRAQMESNAAVIEATSIFGGGEIIVPESWAVVVQGMGIFGGYGDKTRHFQPDPSVPTKTLYIRGVALFGGIDIHN